jgi:hypothetical protein
MNKEKHMENALTFLAAAWRLNVMYADLWSAKHLWFRQLDPALHFTAAQPRMRHAKDIDRGV